MRIELINQSIKYVVLVLRWRGKNRVRVRLQYDPCSNQFVTADVTDQ